MKNQTTYNVFHRTFWKAAESPGWPNNREPHLGEKTYLAHDVSWSVARDICDEWNATHDPGLLSDKAEFEEA